MDMIRLADLDYQSVSRSPLDDRLLQLSSDSREFSDSDETRVTTYSPSEPQHSEASPEFLAWTDRFEGNRASAHTLSLMGPGGLEPKRLITHRFHYTDMVQAYEMAFAREKSMLGVIFNWRD